MSYLAASGVCLAALVGSVIYEKHRIKKEKARIKKTIEGLKRL